jgi:methyltransferase (TIGR00027 family)
VNYTPIATICDTAHIVAVYRALETKRRDALFQDPLAHLLAGERGEASLRTLGNEQTGVNTTAVRTHGMDELIVQLAEREDIDTVLNLAAGLDTRPYRLPLPDTLRWIEVDLPAIIAGKTEKLKHEQPACLLERVPLDLTNDTLRNMLFSRVNRQAKRTLVITEGLLVYLSTEQVAALAASLWEQPTFHWWLFDLVSPFTLQQVQNSFASYFAEGNVSLQFAPEAGIEFFQSYGWQVAEFRSAWEEARRLNREIRLTWLLRLLSRWIMQEPWETFSQRDGIALLKRSRLS